MSTTFTYDIFTKKAEEVKQYDDWVPEILANDQAKLKLVSDKVLPYVFQETLQRVLLSKDANGKNRERFLDLLVLNYPRLGKKSLGEAQETFIVQVRDIKNSLADVVKAIPSSDSTTALRVEIASKNADLMSVALKALNQAAIKKDLDARVALKAPADTSVITRPVLMAYSIASGYDNAIAAKVIDSTAAATERALVLPAGTVGSDFVSTTAATGAPTVLTVGSAATEAGPVTATVTVTAPAASSTTTTTPPSATSTATAPTAGVIGEAVSTTTPSSGTTTPSETASAAGTAAAPSLPASAGPTAAYTPPGAEESAKANETVKEPSTTGAPPSAASSGLSTEAIIGIAVGVLFLIGVVVFIVMANRKSPEDTAAEEAKETLASAPLLPFEQTAVINA